MKPSLSPLWTIVAVPVPASLPYSLLSFPSPDFLGLTVPPMTDLLPEVAPPAWEEAGDTEEPAPDDNKFDTKSSRSFLDDGVFD